MTKGIIGIVALGLLSVSSHASMQEAPKGPPPAPNLPCPANGYAKPVYGGFGDNDGVIRGYEVVSPCVVKEAVDAASALGMTRYNPAGVKNISTTRIGATGTIADDAGRVARYADIDMEISYVIPAIRVTTRAASASGPQSGRVYADGSAWNETAPGVGGRNAPASAAAARAPLPLLTPFGAVLAVVEAEGHASVTKENGLTVISGTSPYDKMPVKVTLDDKNLPIAAEVRAGRNVYTAAFSDYSDKWEPPYLFVFPGKIVWTLNGKPYADLTVTRFKSNPYVVFPSPAELASAK